MPPHSDSSAASRVVVITPTYNEIESLAKTVAAVLTAAPDVDILIVDDASPDGTGELADQLAAADGRVHALHHGAKAGLGLAYLAGIAWATEHDYHVVVEMDADGSHPADALPTMLTMLSSDPAIGLVIGSRWMQGGSVVNWPVRRKLLSTNANRYARVALGLPVHDITAGFRAYRRVVLDTFDASAINSRGYCFHVEITIRTFDAGWDIREVPITFLERVAGVSKMSASIVAEAMWKVTWWGLTRRLGGRRMR